jgi:chromate transport protein ChrA
LDPCTNKYMVRAKLESKINRLIGEKLQDSAFLSRVLEEYHHHLADSPSLETRGVDQDAVRQKLDALRDKKSRVVDAFFEGVIDRIQRDDALRDVERDMVSYNQLLDTSSSRPQSHSLPNLESIVRVIEPLADWEFLGRDDRRALLRQLCPEISVYRYKIKSLTLNLGAASSKFDDRNVVMDSGSRNSFVGVLASSSGLGMPPDERIAAPQRPSFQEALRFWFKLGWISFGGTAAHIAVMHDELVEKKRWISNGAFLHALSHCMILPGPEAQQLAIYIGWKLHGKRGGIIAGTLFVLPSMFVLLALSVVYVRFGSQPWIVAMFDGLKPVVIALVIVALYKIARRALHGPVHIAVAVATFAAMFFFDVSLLLIMFGAVVLGIVLGASRPGLLHRPREVAAEEEEEGYYIRRGSTTPEPVPLLKPIVKLAASVLLLWIMPLVLFCFFVDDFHFWTELALFFTKTAFVTIGGSYTVIP